MSWFSSNKPTPAASSPPTSNTPYSGPGAEQERYATHFSIGQEGFDQVKDAAIKAVNYKGDGAEQDRYAAHFSPDHAVVAKAVRGILQAKAEGAEQDRWGSHFGLGADGWERAKRLAAAKGQGAEQDRFGSHFGVDKDAINKAAQSVQDGVNSLRR
ncbi:hypothetical protein P280DRAFT_469328 [Massarina eburnea CBS 473.64]|uniref:Uncharacterized protein n=1 Tax=Massarina eburnea CBS 473.64 TaxID=1395130 RepID=A0A6A6S0K2_9PLEO|nr:hypothetical protein P280DRAFT_469328 [Massarina eburnea CBS 473.64]